MKKLIALLTVSVAAIAIAAADPVFVGHGFVNFNALGSSYEGTISGKMNGLGAFGDGISAGGGVAVNIPFAGYFGVQTGIDFYFNRIGFKNESSDWVYTYKYTSLDLPILLTAKVEKWNFQIGPYFSFPLGNLTEVTKYPSGGTSAPYEPDINNPVSVGMLFGVGYEERLGLGRIVFGANYMMDFMPTTIKPLNTEYKEFTRRGLIIDIGYKVPLTFF